LGQIDNLLQTVMFTLYGNQYDEMEEHLLLSMFRVRLPTLSPPYSIFNTFSPLASRRACLTQSSGRRLVSAPFCGQTQRSRE
jgi:hypothetical protein